MYAETKYVLDPHGAVALIGLEKELKPGQGGIFLETAHPLKFNKTVLKAIPGIDLKPPKSERPVSKKSLQNDYKALKDLLLTL